MGELWAWPSALKLVSWHAGTLPVMPRFVEYGVCVISTGNGPLALAPVVGSVGNTTCTRR